MSLFHPKKKDLIKWLDGADDPKLEKHISDCEKCSTAMELIQGVRVEETLEQALTLALAPKGDFVDQLEGRVTERLDSREVLSVVSGIFASGLETTRILVTEE